MRQPPRVQFSAGWLALWDDFHQDRYAGRLGARLERWTGSAWVPDEARPLVTTGRALTFPGLGRRHYPRSTDSTIYRVRVETPGYRPLYQPEEPDPPDPARLDPWAERGRQRPADYAERVFTAAAQGREIDVTHYDDVTPPEPDVAPKPEFLPLVPGIDFAYPPGTRVVNGVVRRPGGAGIAGVLVQAVTPDDHLYGDWYERTVTDAQGRFRLALRWRGAVAQPDQPRAQPETFTVGAYESPGHSGTAEVRLDPADGQPGRPEPVPTVIEIGE